MKTLELKPHERLYLWRRDQRLSQAELAERLGIHQATVSKMETGLGPIPDEVLKRIKKVRLTEGDRLAILRRRAGYTQKALAIECRVHPQVIIDMELERRPIHKNVFAVFGEALTSTGE